MVIVIYLGLIGTTALYAAVLERTRRHWDSDLTWLVVVLGVALCLVPAFLIARLYGLLTWREYEVYVWWGFGLGAIPIVIWQLLRSTQAWRAVERHLGSEDGQQDTEALAEECRSSAE